jgi:opacity protein-like surface antigen
MRRVSFLVAAALAFGTAATARAQGLTTGPYAQFQTGLTAGSTVGALFGGEGGFSANSFDLFFEGGYMTNTKSSDMDAAAATIAAGLTTPGNTVTYEAKQPINYFDLGFWYRPRMFGKFQPYGGIGLGSAGVKRETTYAINGSDVTGQLPAMGVTLGGDLQGEERGFFFTLGGGARFGLGERLFVDISYRYGHVSLDTDTVNTNRIQFGIGAHF